MRLSIKLPVLTGLGFLLVAAPTVTTLVLAGRGLVLARTQEANVNSVQTYASAVDFYVDNARSVLETISDLPEIRSVVLNQFADPAASRQADRDSAVRKAAISILNRSSVFEYLMLLRADGAVYLLEPYNLELKLSRRDLAFMSWYDQVMRTDQTVVSDLHISPATQQPSVVIAAPITGPDRWPAGIWAGALKLAELSKVGHGGLESAQPLRYGYVTDKRGLIIAHQTKSKFVESQTDFSQVPAVRAALSGRSGVSRWVNPIDGEEKLGAYMSLPETGWAVVYSEPATTAFAPIDELTRNVALIGAAAFLLAILASSTLSRRISGSIERLAATAKRIGDGDLTHTIEIRTADEIEDLANEFNRMAVSLSNKEEQLRQRAEELEAANQNLENEMSQRQRIAEALYESEERYRSVSELTTDYVFAISVNTDGRREVEWATDGLSKLTGLAPEQMRYPRQWANVVHPDDLSRLGDYFATIVGGQPAETSIRLVVREREIWLSLYGKPEWDSGLQRVYGILGAAKDITQRRQAEEEIMRLNGQLKSHVAELETANRELESFSYSVSHDLRAPLRAIDGFSRMLLEKHAQQLAPEPQRLLHVVRDNARKMGNLIDDLLTFSRLSRQPLKRYASSLAEVVGQALEDLHAEVEGRPVEINLNDLSLCQADPRLLKQVFVNLLSNALKFSRSRETARIEVGSQFQNGERVYFVRDNGVGFDMRYVGKLFGVFQRLHRPEDYEGTGVGLAIVQRIIHRHCGRVWAEAEVDKGATFYFTLEEEGHDS